MEKFVKIIRNTEEIWKLLGDDDHKNSTFINNELLVLFAYNYSSRISK